MVSINENFLRLKGSYLFSDIAKRLNAFNESNPDANLIRLSIGDVTRPLPKACIDAMHLAVDEMAVAETFKGYGPELGYDFLREAIADNDYKKRGVDIKAEEIFVSDGAKCDTANIVDIFGVNNVVALGDPVYPVYLDTNVMAGRSGKLMDDGNYEDIIYMPCTEENGFTPQIPDKKADLIYLCFPNNPVGVTPTREYLKSWVKYALENKSVILYDSAYEAFITDESVPRTIFEIDGAKKCAIEFRSFSKTAGFTGTRCGYTVVPKELVIDGNSIYDLWSRRQSTKFNGVSYIIQKGAAAVFTEAGQKEVNETIAYYLNNAKYIGSHLKDMGLKVVGGENAPYIWVKTPNNMKSWEFFDFLLNNAAVATTPGVGFGPSGEGYIRLTAFGKLEDTKTAVDRIASVSSKW